MLALIFCLATFGAVTHSDEAHVRRKIAPAEVAAVVQAVQDEIYDYGFEGDYFQFGANLANDALKWKSRVPIYIDPDIENGEGRAIYKLVHDGEVYRLFSIRKNGVAVLDGDPELEFPPTQASHKTLYMDDDEVCRMRHDWLRVSFEIDTAPAAEMVRDSARRQKERTGFSFWESVILPNQNRRKVPSNSPGDRVASPRTE